MAGKAGLGVKLLPGVVGALALGLIAVPLMAPNASVSEAADPGPAVVSPDPDTLTPSDPIASSGQAVDPSPSTPQPSATDVATDEDAEAAVLAALTAYESQMTSAGGVQGSFISADSQEMTVSLNVNGDFRAITTNPDSPEWLYVDPVLYARLGAQELKAQQKALIAIGKPDAVWTDAAMNSDKQGVYLSAANIANAVADLLPLMTRLRMSEGPDGGTVVQGVVDLTADLGLNAEAYNLAAVDDSSTDTNAMTQASVVFTIDTSGVLQGYIVQPPGSAQPVSLLLTEFAVSAIKRPSPPRVITIEDLAPLIEDGTSAPTPSPSASPSAR